MYYEVRLNGGSSNRVYNETDTSIEINGLERGVEYTAVIEAFDNVGRRGEASELNFILDSEFKPHIILLAKSVVIIELVVITSVGN